MRKVLLVALLSTSLVSFSQDLKKVIINISGSTEKEDPEMKNSPVITGDATLWQKNYYANLELAYKNYSASVGYKKTFFNNTNVGMGINTTSTQNIFKGHNLLFGSAIILNHSAKALEVDFRVCYSTNFKNNNDNWKQNQFAVVCWWSLKISQTRFRIGAWIEYLKTGNKEPRQFSNEYTLLYETHTEWSDIRYTENRMHLRFYASYVISKNFTISAGPMISESKNEIVNGLTTGLNRTTQRWDYKSFFIKGSLRF